MNAIEEAYLNGDIVIEPQRIGAKIKFWFLEKIMGWFGVGEEEQPCGNGILDYSLGEECDDGNLIDGDGCRSDCSLEQCGDGVVDKPAEECDDGNNVDGDGCNFCLLPVCGDGILDYANGEECDDGNAVDGDGCRSDCSLEQCGDGIVDKPAEQCDDGNNVVGDGCDMCVIEQADTILDGTITVNTNQMNQVIKLVFTEVNNPANTFQTNIVLDEQGQIKSFNEDVGFNINPSDSYEIIYEWVSGSKILVIDSVVEGVDLIDPTDSVALGDGSIGTHAGVNITFSPAGGIISGPVIIG
ncbi:DUF4215 domain-containing protein [Candidatus Woesearchaeota archaeon]|nr:DUF4215 domain-containing protein [Candidatus Woesearchaeota archaeon]